MSLKSKYQSVINLSEKFGMKDSAVEELDGKLKVNGTVETQYLKNQIWDKIKEIGGETPSDIAADIRVEVTDYYHKHTVEKGESLSKIAKHYYEEANKYMKIFNANTDQLKDPDMIHPGQELIIPFE
ncbi:MAG: LysM peptidoglycan-binding domain-containing protein [Saprospiraceae bacterium]|nr:LysM peptidoglycan-binding domain-containing protein [Saprospiraceae bacterium]